MSLNDQRKRIDEVDAQLTRLFAERMEIAKEIAHIKQENNLPVMDPARERQKLLDIGDSVPEELRGYAIRLYSTLFDLSRQHQLAQDGTVSPLQQRIADAVRNTPPLFPERPRVALQGVEGSYSQSAAEKLFHQPNLMFFSTFEGVFRALDQGLCRYGVLPLENSTAGSVNRIYDLMMQYDFSIVRSTRIKVDHCLLTLPGVSIKDIKEVTSHEQALTQCENFLRGLGKDVKITAAENTAQAAKHVQESGRKDLAALSSRSCAQLYGLKVVQASVQDSGANFTRFICLSKQLEIYPGADKTSVMMVLPHRPGSLYMALGRLNSLGINLIKLESRPLPNSDFEFMFYFDLETSVYAPEFLRVFADLQAICSEFRYLGSYAEVV